METTSHFLIQKSIVQEGVEYKATISSGADKFESPERLCVGQSTHDDTRETERSKVGIMSLRVGGLLPLPAYASCRESWNVTERGSLLVGLYIFGRNFYVINKFMGEKGTGCQKGMGDILAYYYGDFYKSEDYKSWRLWRKERQERPKESRKVLIGLQHNELLSRLSVNATYEYQDRLAKAGEEYLHILSLEDPEDAEGEENIHELALRKFMFTLSGCVGMNLLVEALAIGQKGRDLLEFPKTCKPCYVKKEFPTSNKNSYLTKQAIVHILKSGVRLTTGKSNNLFSKVVWARLVERGWQSMHAGYDKSKNWVFLVPGVDSFPNNKFEKGIHYFDSVDDVLSKVALEPEILDQDYLQTDDSSKHKRVPENASLASNQYEKRIKNNMIDLTVPHMVPDSESGESSLSQKPKPNQLECFNVRTSKVHKPVVVQPQRCSMRNRTLTTKSWEAYNNGYLRPKKKRKGEEETPSRQGCGKTRRRHLGKVVGKLIMNQMVVQSPEGVEKVVNDSAE